MLAERELQHVLGVATDREINPGDGRGDLPVTVVLMGPAHHDEQLVAGAISEGADDARGLLDRGRRGRDARRVDPRPLGLVRHPLSSAYHTKDWYFTDGDRDDETVRS
jgi:hypothetical protein